MPRPAILIVGNAGLGIACVPNVANGVVGGCGTADNPYVIESWSIDGSVTPECSMQNGLCGGITLSQTTAHVLIRNNLIRHHKVAEIWLDRVSNARIENNVIGSTGSFVAGQQAGTGILISDSQIVTISDNDVQCILGPPGFSNGVATLGSSGALVLGANDVSGCYTGININSCGGIQATDNSLTSNQYGLVMWCSNVSLEGNVISNSGVHGVSLSGGTGQNVTISHNLVTNNTGIGIYVGSTNAAVTDNVISYNLGGGLRAGGTSALNTYSGNNIFGNSNYGACACSTLELDLRDNWWGSSSGPSGAGSGTGDVLLDNPGGEPPLFDPWLTSANPMAGP